MLEVEYRLMCYFIKLHLIACFRNVILEIKKNYQRRKHPSKKRIKYPSDAHTAVYISSTKGIYQHYTLNFNFN